MWVREYRNEFVRKQEFVSVQSFQSVIRKWNFLKLVQMLGSKFLHSNICLPGRSPSWAN